VLLVHQWRTPANGVLLEIPAGTLDVVDESTGAIEDPDLAARRELEEETGYRAETWRKLAAFWTAPGFASEKMHLYLATDLRPAHPDERLGPDEDEHLQLDPRAFDEAIQLVENGEINDAKSIAGLLWVERLRGGRAAATTVGGESSAGDLIVGLRTFTPTIREYADASGRIARDSVATVVVGGFFAILGIANIALDVPAVGVPAMVLGVLMATGLLSAGLATLVAVRFRDQTLKPRTVGVGRDGFVFRTADSGGYVRWQHYRRIRRSGPFLILDLGIQKQFVPLRVFDAEEQAEVRRIVRAADLGRLGASAGRGST